jgi:uncharacterized protein
MTTAVAAGGGPAVPSAAAAVALRPLPLSGSRLADGFWAGRVAANQAAIPAGYERLSETGHLDNLRIAADEMTGVAKGAVFWDSDVYK